MLDNKCKDGSAGKKRRGDISREADSVMKWRARSLLGVYGEEAEGEKSHITCFISGATDITAALYSSRIHIGVSHQLQCDS